MLHQVNHPQAAMAIEACIKAKRPLMLMGRPGCGKSDLFRQVIARLERRLFDVRVSLLDAVDLRGMPMVDHESRQTRWAPPVFLPTPKDGPSVIFLDEVNAGRDDVMAALYQLILDRRIGEYVLPDDCVVVAAGNKLSDGASARRMPTALVNRFTILELVPRVTDVSDWMLNHGTHPVIPAFLHFRPHWLEFSPSVATSAAPNPAFPTARSLASLDGILRAGLPMPVECSMIAGTVGQACAEEMIAFISMYRDLPDVRRIEKDPDGEPVSSQPNVRYAVTFALASMATVKTMGAFSRYMMRLPMEYQVVYFHTIGTRDGGKLTATPAFARWAREHTSELV